MGLIKGMAKLAGETARIKKDEKHNAIMDVATRNMINSTIDKAKSGDVESMSLLATWYKRGEYVGYNPLLACEWWKAAAEKGDCVSQFNLGVMYLGNESAYCYNPDLAAYWLSCAANNGDKEAYDLLNSKFRYSNFWKKWKLRE